LKDDKGKVDSLIDKLLNDEDYNERMEAAFDLGNIGDKKAFEPLLKALKDENPQVRKFAALSVGKYQDPKAVDPLIKLIEDKSDQSRYGAVMGLSHYNEEKIAKLMVKLLKDPESDNDIQVAILDALKSYENPKIIDELIDYWPDARRRSLKSKLIDIFDMRYEMLSKFQINSIKILLEQILDDRIRDLSSNRVIGHHYDSGIEIPASELAYTILLKNKKFVTTKHLKLIESLIERDDTTKDLAQELLEELKSK